MFISAYSLQSPWREARTEIHAGSWRQELKNKPGRKALYRLALHDLLSLLSNVTYNHLSRVEPTMSWALPMSIINQRSVPINLTRGQPGGGNFSIEGLFSLVTVTIAAPTEQSIPYFKYE